MSKFSNARICIVVGLVFLILDVINGYLADSITPTLIRSSVLCGILSVILMLIGFLWEEVRPISREKVKLKGKQGIFILDRLNQDIKNELAWGTHQILTATAAATVLIYWNQSTLIRRGLISLDDFMPGPICIKSMQQAKFLSLPVLKLYPGKDEFSSILENLPSVLIQPLGTKGFIVIGGWSEKCFTKSDEKWIEGWSIRLRDCLNK